MWEEGSEYGNSCCNLLSFFKDLTQSQLLHVLQYVFLALKAPCENRYATDLAQLLKSALLQLFDEQVDFTNLITTHIHIQLFLPFLRAHFRAIISRILLLFS